MSQLSVSRKTTNKALPDVRASENYGIRISNDDQVYRKFLDEIRKNCAQWWARTR